VLPVADRGLSPPRLLNYVARRGAVPGRAISQRGPNFAMITGNARHRIRSASRTSVKSCAGRADGNGASVVLSLFCAPRRNRYGSCCLCPHGPQPGRFPRFQGSCRLAAWNVFWSAAIERLRWQAEPYHLVAARQLGVRAGEVVGLSLDDIDWSTGQITIRGKGGKSAQLPLVNDVAPLLPTICVHDRPRSATRRSVPSPPAPLVGFGNSSTISRWSGAL